MKYKVGDKVKVRSDLRVNTMYGGAILVEDMGKYIGKTMTVKEVYADSYCLEEDVKRRFWTEAMLEHVPKTMLEPCMVVKMRNGALNMVMTGNDRGIFLITRDKEYLYLKSYDDNLKYRLGVTDFDIVEIYGLSYNPQKSMDISTECRYLLWKRDEVKKMTVAEIQEALGYKIEIVEDE